MASNNESSSLRRGKLAKYFKQVVFGSRKINTVTDAALFIEAVCSQEKPTICVETLLTKTAGLDAVRDALRLDLSVAFLHTHAINLIRYISSPLLKTLADGQLLTQLLVAIACPPTFWRAICASVKQPGVPATVLEPFAWLTWELLSLPARYDVNVVADVQDITNANLLLETTLPFQVRSIGYKIQHTLKLKSTAVAGDCLSAAHPGGRHDNDFADFRQIAIFPTADELMCSERPFYRTAREVFETTAEDLPRVYLDHLFRLLRESLLADLREDVRVATRAKKPRRRPTVLAKLVPQAIYTQKPPRKNNARPFKTKCHVALSCNAGLETLANKSPAARKQYLLDHPGFLRHQALGVLICNTDTFGFAFVDRDEDMLVSSPPRVCLQFADRTSFEKSLLALRSSPDVKFVLVDAAVFAVEPILRRLQSIVEIPLAQHLLKGTDGSQAEQSPFEPHPDVKEYVAKLRSLPVNNDDGTVTLPDLNSPADLLLDELLGTSGHSGPTKLDASQLESLVASLLSAVSLIQGPPGTGKSFLGALFVKILFHLTNWTILITTYTNHALNQCLGDLVDMGIDRSQIVRLGSKTDSKTADLSLETKPKTYHKPKEERKLAYSYDDRLEEHGEQIVNAFKKYVGFRLTFESLVEYLEFSDNYSRFVAAFTIPPTERDMGDSRHFRRAGKRNKVVRADYLFWQWRNGRNAGIFHGHPSLSAYASIWALHKNERWELINKWEHEMILDQISTLASLAETHDREKEILDGLNAQSKKATVQMHRIIGCTTTAASKYADVILAAEPDVILVEEAGEILEAQVLAALAPTVKQLALIGDHKQLRPKVDCYDLSVEKGSGFDLNRSLFERLILHGHPHSILRKQHRMCPEISIFSREDTYPEMVDAPSAQERSCRDGRRYPKGLQDRVIFVNHGSQEDTDDALIDHRDPGAKDSKSNSFEAKMVLMCVRYLGQQGYGTKDIVVLTPYLGQLRTLTNLLRHEVDPVLNDLDSSELYRAGLVSEALTTVIKRPLRISTIDNYQGEESDIVIVSLTRCNANGDIGFMAAPERVNVLRTRARDCLIMIGNARTFQDSRRGSKIWAPFLESLSAKGHMYDGLPVQCQQHTHTTNILKCPGDFDKRCPDGGCSLPCGAMLPCKVHKCLRQCHRITDHSKVTCKERVTRTCDRNHKLVVLCSQLQEICEACLEEDRDMERQARRHLELEKKRLLRQKVYKNELQQMEDEIAHQNRIMKYCKEEEDQKMSLEKKKSELETVKLAAQKTAEEKQRESQQLDEPRPGNGLEFPTCETAEEWEFLKQYLGAQCDSLDKMMAMVGLNEVKKQFLDLKSLVDTTIKQGASLSKERFGCVLLGNPGTGKTTVARFLAEFLSSAGVIPGSRFEETTGAALANAGVSGCKKMIDDMLNDSGGVIFIDEAYQLTSGASHGGTAVLDYLLPVVENTAGNIVFVLAGYSRQMESFFSHNPGLPSRFPVEMRFADYTDKELLHIMSQKVLQRTPAMKAQEGFDGLYFRVASRRVGRGRDRPGFGNARAAENALARMNRRQANRLRRETRAGSQGDVMMLTKEDIIGPEPKQALAESTAWNKLQQMVGLTAVKDAVRALMDSVQHNYERELTEQPPVQFSLNKLFLGSPGTGKTTVARLYGEILVDLGLLSKGEVVVRNPSDLVGSALGESEKNTRGILAATEGKILVIDEAYGLYGRSGNASGSGGDIYKTAVVDTIVAEVQNVPGDDRCVLLLGYREEMEDMLRNVNPGLSRRFPLASAFVFEDFDDADLRRILDLKLSQQGFTITDQAKRVALDMLSRARNRPNFGNAGEIDILLNSAKERQQKRISKGSAANSTAAGPAGPVDSALLVATDFDENFDRVDRRDSDVKRLFADTVGQDEIIARLESIQGQVRAHRHLGLDPREPVPFTFLFRGPPGTGKTTTARKMGKVYYDLGFLDSARVEQCSVTDLVGQYVGQTGLKVLQVLDKALGRVLLIDEAYRLCSSSFAQEAVDELVDALTKERYRKRLVVILAGYTDGMNRLMATNPGLMSRFPDHVDFRALRAPECVTLLGNLLRKQKAELQKKGVGLNLAVLEANSAAHSFVVTIQGLFDELSHQTNWGSTRDVETIAKAVFSMAIEAPRDDSEPPRTMKCIAITEAQIVQQLSQMLVERKLASAAADPLHHLTAHMRQEEQRQLPEQDDRRDTVKTIIQTGIQTTDAAAEGPRDIVGTEPQDDSSKASPLKAEIGSILRTSLDAQRDPGVSDAVWEQLQRDRKEMEEKEAEYQRLKREVNEADSAGEERRQHIILKLLEEDKKREEELALQKKLQASGRCPVGYAWVKQPSGWRCAGGSHFMSSGDVGKMQ